ncbi:hypothetical protein GMW39_23825 [Pectobacterium parmentieri]|uniref:hypothetical protein n=1 Tax=Pectobacterium parmentieri TaxID=1905730 RepID=UPI0013741EB9|nr:hypothetical protein [Pectobacterium parmentieri]QHQ18559.1 hypothetical protein GMW39_23825 [Pectobacterium parmentieri]QQA76813.1 hypothetical protein JBL47_04110 [Pectobacterium parmentieri]
MSNKLKYDRAYYYEGSIEKEILAIDLSNERTYFLAKSKILFDKSGYTLLRPRFCKDKTCHFYTPNTSNKREITSFETDKSHNEHIDYLLTLLNTKEKFIIGNSIFKDKKIVGFSPLAILNEYEWGIEIHRISNNQLTLRHDLFGTRRSLAMSIHHPWVAIEVINKHFPEEKAFTAMIELSKQIPFLVMFDLLTEKTKNYFLKIDTIKKQITPIFYIFEGHVWHGDCIQENITTSAILEKRMKECERKIKDLRSKKDS